MCQIRVHLGHSLLHEWRVAAGAEGGVEGSAEATAGDMGTPVVLDVRCPSDCYEAKDVAAVLRVQYGSGVEVGVQLPSWSSLVAATWRVGVGAGATDTSDTHFGKFDSPHIVSAFHLTAGTAFRPTTVPFGVSFNGHDFLTSSSAGKPLVSTFVYGAPHISSVFPRSGEPYSEIAIRGDLLPFQRGVGESGGYRCQFAEQVAAAHASDAWASIFDYDGHHAGRPGEWELVLGGKVAEVDAALRTDSQGEYLLCESPPELQHGMFTLEVSLHDAAFGMDRVHFAAVESRSAAIHALPNEAPGAGEALLLLSGMDLHGGIAYACRATPSYATSGGSTCPRACACRLVF